MTNDQSPPYHNPVRDHPVFGLNIGETELSEILAELEEIYQVDLVEEQGNIETVQDLVELISEQIE